MARSYDSDVAMLPKSPVKSVASTANSSGTAIHHRRQPSNSTTDLIQILVESQGTDTVASTDLKDDDGGQYKGLQARYSGNGAPRESMDQNMDLKDVGGLLSDGPIPKPVKEDSSAGKGYECRKYVTKSGADASGNKSAVNSKKRSFWKRIFGRK